MCGVVRTSSSDSIVAPQEAAGMPPSVTVGGTEPSKVTPPPTEVPCHLLQQQGASSREIPTIDLAADESDDLQKAIELSLQEQPVEQPALPIAGLTAEEQDMSKALEVSLQDTSSSTTVEIINPQDRKRVIGIPVGLKNIGNSCWFNVVIQPLFFIPLFREMIINYPRNIEEEITFSKAPAERLVPALRHLFSLLVASEKKYVDPTEAINLFQGQEMRKNTQQDVCEFIHKLLEKLEEEFKLLIRKQGIEKESSECGISKESDFENPIMKVFYGQCKRDGLDDSGSAIVETFGQYPLTVMKYKDIHESILASMIGGSVEETSSNIIKPVNQEMWFKTLPSVLIFSLSRYEYSKEKKRAEKVHNKFDFPEYLFMDRYMEVNKENVKKKHLKIAKIQQELSSLYSALEKYQKFGSGDAKYPITDILKYALEFAGTIVEKCEEANHPVQFVMEVDTGELNEMDVEMVESKEISSDALKNSLTHEKVCQEFMSTNSSDGTSDSSVVLEACGQISPNKKMRLLPPAPQNINPGELPVLQACLPRWQKEVETQVSFLKKSIGELEEQLTQMFEEPELHHIPYKLHAVVVHEGQASGGHYWVYIYDSFKDIWMKFNDIQVTESNWQELLQDSIGGQNNASAYCLMYIEQASYNMMFSGQKLNLDNLSSCLPLDLQEYVKQDNLLFIHELEEWDSKQEQQINNESDARAVPATAPNSPVMYGMDDDENNFFLEVQAMLSQTLMKALKNEEWILQEKNKSHWLYSTVNAELSRLKEIATQTIQEDCYSEPSVLDLGIYLTRNKEKYDYLLWYAYEIVWHLSQNRNSKAMNLIHSEAADFLHRIGMKHMATLGPTYLGWKKHYKNLVTCMWYFIYGYRKIQSGEFETALLHMMQALRLHKLIKDTPPSGCAKTLDFKVLGYWHRKCLTIVNDKLADTFLKVETEAKAMDVAEAVTRLIVPALWFLTNSKNKDDEITADLVRNRWCQAIDAVPTNISPLIKQIIEGVYSEGCEGPKQVIKIKNIPPVLSLYKEYKDSFLISSECNDAQTSDL